LHHDAEQQGHRFDWTPFPATLKVIEMANLTSVRETSRFLDVYKMATTTYKGEGGGGDLDMRSFKVF